MARSQIPIAAKDSERPSLEALQKLFRDPASKAPHLAAPDNASIELPPSLYEVFKAVLPILERGDMVSIIPVSRMLTTQEAAHILNVSREYVRQLLQKGDIPFSLVGTHKRVAIDDLMRYREQEQERQMKLMREIIEIGTNEKPT